MSLVKWIDFKTLVDDRGALTPIENSRDIPFDIKRVYYLYHLDPKARRGFHAHKQLRQVAVCLSGHCTILLNNGREQAEVNLHQPNRGLIIDKQVWHEMFDFSPDCVLLVLASDFFDESDYIRCGEEFRNGVNS